MAAEQLLLDFAVILIAAEIGGALFRRIRMPRAVGMLVAGIVLGPFTPGYVIHPSAVADLAVLGAVFLMFTTGLSFDIRNFRKLGAWPFLLAIAGVDGLQIGMIGLTTTMTLRLVPRTVSTRLRATKPRAISASNTASPPNNSASACPY